MRSEVHWTALQKSDLGPVVWQQRQRVGLEQQLVLEGDVSFVPDHVGRGAGVGVQQREVRQGRGPQLRDRSMRAEQGRRSPHAGARERIIEEVHQAEPHDGRR